jgi:hypothetical protein
MVSGVAPATAASKTNRGAGLLHFVWAWYKIRGDVWNAHIDMSTK